MSYTKQTWQTGDIITAEKLNHMEDGISSAQLYSVSEDVRFSGSVTTVDDGEGPYADIDCDLSDAPEQITVTFDGTEYTCEKLVGDDFEGYGGYGESGPDFSEYPFFIFADSLATILTETAGTHQVEISADTKTINQYLADSIPVMRLGNGVTNSADAVAAFNAGKLLYFPYNDGFYIVTGIDDENEVFTSIPSNNFACDFSGVKIAIYPRQG